MNKEDELWAIIDYLNKYKPFKNVFMKIRKLKTILLVILFFLVFQISQQTSFAQTDPKIEGSPYKEINYENPAKPIKEEEREKIEKTVKKGVAPKMSAKAPKTRTRGEDLTKANRTIYQFTNWDFPVTGNTCGQAAVATAMWNRGLNVAWNQNAADFAKQLYAYAPPKITIPGLPSNTVGTDWNQINYALNGYKKYGIQYSWFKGRALLNKYVDMGLPCIIMLDMGVFGKNMWGSGHWVVAFARNANGYFVTNWDVKWNGNNNNYVSWDELNKAWGGVWNEGQMAKVHGTAEMFCVVWK